uniref:Uncharacterized protein n=1 Tax=Quercus lobata TaxID=97700 RepID=A0A7N2MRI5_QUELO
MDKVSMLLPLFLHWYLLLPPLLLLSLHQIHPGAFLSSSSSPLPPREGHLWHAEQELVFGHFLRPSLTLMLVAGLSRLELIQGAIIRAYLYEHAKEKVTPYGIWSCDSPVKGVEGKIKGNILARDENSVAFDR